MKRITEIILLASILLMIVGCKKENNDNNFPSLDCGEVSFIENYSMNIPMGYDRIIDRDIELARGDWKDDGFTIELPKTLDPNYLHALINNNRVYMTIINPPSTVSISNKNVKVGNVAFWGVDKDGNVVTRFYPIEIDSDGNGQDAYYTYVDSDVTISESTYV